jgi:hypothetical protein
VMRLKSLLTLLGNEIIKLFHNYAQFYSLRRGKDPIELT